MSALRIFHTADWHLGKNFANFDRSEDFRLFIDDFLDLIRKRRPNVLLLSGDIFDTSMPSSAAQSIYYDFIGRLRETDVALTVITAGNHDSQRFLEASRPLLSNMRCIVAGDTAEEEAVIFKNNGLPCLGIAAVPYLREADVRPGNLDYSELDRTKLFEMGVSRRYREVRRLLDQQANGYQIPMVAMGHLFVTGSKMKPDGSGSDREKNESIHVGSLRNVSADAFGHDWDYIALGHIHNSQQVKNPEPMYYSGSPLALSFGHRDYEHIVIEINIDESRRIDIVKHPVKQPRRFITLQGNLNDLLNGIAAAGAAKDDREPLIEAKLTSHEIVGDLVGLLQKAGDKAGVRVMIVRNEAVVEKLIQNECIGWDLSQLTPEEVFRAHLNDRFEPEEAGHYYRELIDLFKDVEHEVSARLNSCEPPVTSAKEN